ncbi:MAG: hypothetical protein HY698_04815 [Deltaproteobacteria bacterium]|nr:hypothetical protein [Deltaproteobacteria bacterium]
MPKRRTEFDARLNAIIADHISDLTAAISHAVRQNIADEIQSYLAGVPAGPVSARGIGRRVGPGRPAKRRSMACIAPGCTNSSKGPRFHYLCEKHMDAPKKDYEAWRKGRKGATA